MRRSGVNITFFSLVFLGFFSTASSATLPDLANPFAAGLSTDLLLFENNVLRAGSIQSFFDSEVPHDASAINGNRLIANLSSALGDLFNNKDVAVRDITEQVRISYARRATEPLIGTVFDSSDPSTFPPLTFDARFNTLTSRTQSSLKFAPGISREGENIQETIRWTSHLDSIFSNNLDGDRDLKWQYFGSADGFSRIFPGYEWETDSNGEYTTYDPRTRPWYVEASSGAKDIIVLLDISGSMNIKDRLGLAKEAVSTILGTLSVNDFFNIVVFDDQVESLTCFNETMVRGTDENKARFLNRLEELEADGGTNFLGGFRQSFEMIQRSRENEMTSQCATTILFLTDGNSLDPTDVIDQFNEDKSVRIFSYILGEQADPIIPSKIACDNFGTMNQIREGGDLKSTMVKYYEYLGVGQEVWSAPYIDAFGLGLMITRSLPIYSDVINEVTGLFEFVGVVGVDVTLDDTQRLVLNFMEAHEAGDAYAFLIYKDGSVIIHPRLSIFDEVIFYDVSELEMTNGEPASFMDLRRQMIQEPEGEVSLDMTRQVPKGEADREGVRTEVIPTTYFWRRVVTTDFTVVIAIPTAQLTDFPTAQSPSSFDPSYYHTVSLYANTQIVDVPLVLQSHPLQSGTQISLSQSVFKIAPSGFCDPIAYLGNRTADIDNVDLVRFIHFYVNDSSNPVNTELDECLNFFKSTVAPIVRATQPLQDIWLQNSASFLQGDFTYQYFGSDTGVSRLWPGTYISSKSFDPTDRPWYTRALGDPDVLTISVPYLDALGSGTVVTASKAIQRECGAANCSKPIAGVTGIDFTYSLFRNLIAQELPSQCGLEYSCGSRTCQTRCYVLDRNGYFVYHPDFDEATFGSDEETFYRFLGAEEGILVQHLMNESNFFEVSQTIDYKTGCEVEEDEDDDDGEDSAASSLFHYSPTWSSLTVEPSVSARQALPPVDRPRLIDCAKDVKVYSVTQQYFNQNLTGTIQHECLQAHYQISPVLGTNLFVMVLQNYYRDPTQLFNDRGRLNDCPVLIPTRDAASREICNVTEALFRESAPCAYPYPRSQTPCIPDCSAFDNCNNNGDCLNGICICSEGFGGDTCAPASSLSTFFSFVTLVAIIAVFV